MFLSIITVIANIYYCLLHTSHFKVLFTHYFILEMRKLRLREVKHLVPHHSWSLFQSLCLNQAQGNKLISYLPFHLLQYVLNMIKYLEKEKNHFQESFICDLTTVECHNHILQILLFLVSWQTYLWLLNVNSSGIEVHHPLALGTCE